MSNDVEAEARNFLSAGDGAVIPEADVYLLGRILTFRAVREHVTAPVGEVLAEYMSASFDGKVRMALNAEYGENLTSTVFPPTNTTFTVGTVPFAEVIVGNVRYMERKPSVCTPTTTQIVGVLRKQSPHRYRLMDGYHRFDERVKAGVAEGVFLVATFHVHRER